MPTISDQGIDGCAARKSRVSRRAASPTISISLTRARARTSSFRSARDRPSAISSARRPASRMWRSAVSSSAYVVDRLRLAQDALADVTAERVGLGDVDLAAEQLLQVDDDPAV